MSVHVAPIKAEEVAWQPGARCTSLNAALVTLTTMIRHLFTAEHTCVNKHKKVVVYQCEHKKF